MSQQIEEIKTNVKIVQDGLRKMGADRAVALSVHVTKELIAELEQTTAKLAELVEGL